MYLIMTVDNKIAFFLPKEENIKVFSNNY